MKKFLEADEATTSKAKAFLLEKWQEYALERWGSSSEKPDDLTNACKFCALFAEAVFGAERRANYEHEFNILNGNIFDLTYPNIGLLELEEKGYPIYSKDRAFFNSRDHRYSIDTCRPRVARWVDEFYSLMPHSELPEP